MFRLLVAGEYAIAGQALLHDIIDDEEKGTRIDFVKPEGRTEGFQQTSREKDPDAPPTSVLAAGLIQVEEHHRP
jgi:hypothetical protein